MLWLRSIVVALGLVVAVACSEASSTPDAQAPGPQDATVADAAPADAGALDAAGPDASPADASALDAAVMDAGAVSSTRALTMREVSVLFPLPPVGGLGGLLAADTMGVGGPLVPALIYEQLPQLLLSTSAEVLYGQLRVIAARLDPCANRLTDQPCHAEVRLVLQPLTADGGATSAADAAIHAIYGVEAGEFARVIAALRVLGDGEPELAHDHGLGVHPVMAREGLDGAYARGLRTLLLSAVGEGRLRRLTFMQLSGRANVWIFGGFDRSPAGVYSPTRIPGVDTPTQQIVHNVFDDTLRVGVTPTVRDADDFSLLYESDAIRAASEVDRTAALDAALRVESPRRHDPDTVDCARCHVAFVSRRWTERVLGVDTSSSAHRYRAPGYDLSVPEDIRPPQAQRTFRAFGWLGQLPAISARTANETAEVLLELRP